MSKLSQALTGFLTVRAAVAELHGIRVALESIAAALDRHVPRGREAVNVEAESGVRYADPVEIALAEGVKERMRQTLGREPSDAEWLSQFEEELRR